MKSSYPHPLTFQPLQIVSTLRILIIRSIGQGQDAGGILSFLHVPLKRVASQEEFEFN